MKNDLYNDIARLLVCLQELGITESHNNIAETLDLLAEEINTSIKAIKTRAHVFLDEEDIGKVQQCIELTNAIGDLSGKIHSLKNANTYYDSKDDNKQVKVEMTPAAKNNPIAFHLNGRKYYLKRHTWRQLLYQVLCALAEIDINKFHALVQMLNDKQVTYYKFSANADNLVSDTYKNRPWHIPSANLYVQLIGSASVMQRSAKEVVRLFGLEASFSIDTNNDNTKDDNIINIVDDEEE